MQVTYNLYIYRAASLLALVCAKAKIQRAYYETYHFVRDLQRGQVSVRDLIAAE